jgi:hypothetical protein
MRQKEIPTYLKIVLALGHVFITVACAHTLSHSPSKG